MNTQILHKLAYGCGQKKLITVSTKGQRSNGVSTLGKTNAHSKTKVQEYCSWIILFLILKVGG